MFNRILMQAGCASFLYLILSVHAFAHPPGLSSLDIELSAGQINAKVTFALQDIEAFVPMDSDLDAEVSATEREAAKPRIAQLLSEQLQISGNQQALLPVSPGSVNYDDQNNAQVKLQYAVPNDQPLRVQSKFLALLPEGHQQFLSIKDATGQVLVEKMLSKQNDAVELNPQHQAAAETNTFAEFFILGIEHIVTGYDHLLFLFALLAVTHSFWPALKIITFFTIAHSITLACAGLNLIELPSSVVEPLIAATIIYVGIENIVRGEHPKGRHWLTFGFGLIHGFGFAGVLREMDITSGDSGIVLPLLSFNLGIESGQIAVATIVLPMIWWLNNNVETSERFLKACSIAVSLMGAYWLVERTMM